ncbi:uncharacterized protein NEMAJ01_0193 [Nematocida major]|uniref:uncharacterized protein n=1 Tax=Nematocida major TaxID=1912982 RepID=UPI0020077DF6|nr:uncharacterized protein NEMAJ01_0193 [Nematocida major]KAH9385297.1 hypothetical protein NEMAJ01_0193 [Nematocida major]
MRARTQRLSWGILSLALLCGIKADSLFLGVDTSIFSPCINTFNGTFITSGSKPGKALYKKTLDFSGKLLYLPNIVGTEPDFVKSKNKIVALKNDTVSIEGNYTVIPNIVIFTDYLKMILDPHKKSNILNAGLNMRAYSPEKEKRMAAAALKNALPGAAIQILTDGISQAISSLTANTTSKYVVAYTLRGERPTAEICLFDEEGKTLTLSHTEVGSGFSEYDIVRLVHAHVIKAVAEIARNKCGNVQIRSNLDSVLGYDDDSDSRNREDSRKSDQSTATALGDSALDRNESVLNSREDTGSASEGKSDAVASTGSLHTLTLHDSSVFALLEKALMKIHTLPLVEGPEGLVLNRAEKQEVSTLSILYTDEAGKTGALLPQESEEALVIPVEDLLQEVVAYFKQALPALKDLVDRSNDLLQEKIAEKPLPVEISIFNDLLQAHQLVSLLHGLNISGAYTPSKSDLASASIHMKRMKVSVRAKNTVDFGHEKIPVQKYVINGEERAWSEYFKCAAEEKEVAPKIRRLLQGDAREAEEDLGKEGVQQLLALVGEPEPENFRLLGRWILEYAKIRREIKIQAETKKAVLQIQDAIKKAVDSGNALVESAGDGAAEAVSNFRGFLERNSVVEGVPEVAGKFSEAKTVQEQVSIRRQLKTILEGVQYRAHCIREELREEEERREQARKEMEAAEKVVEPENAELPETEITEKIAEPESKKSEIVNISGAEKAPEEKGLVEGGRLPEEESLVLKDGL